MFDDRFRQKKIKFGHQFETSFDIKIKDFYNFTIVKLGFTARLLCDFKL